MLKEIILPALLGFIWGFLVSLFNNFWTARALYHPKSKLAVLFFVLRQGINVLAMFLVYRNVPMLIGTALGLLAVKNYIFIKCLNDMRLQKRKE